MKPSFIPQTPLQLHWLKACVSRTDRLSSPGSEPIGVRHKLQNLGERVEFEEGMLEHPAAHPILFSWLLIQRANV